MKWRSINMQLTNEEEYICNDNVQTVRFPGPLKLNER